VKILSRTYIYTVQSADFWFSSVSMDTTKYGLSWWLHWLRVGLVIERSLVRLPTRALSSQ